MMEWLRAGLAVLVIVAAVANIVLMMVLLRKKHRPVVSVDVQRRTEDVYREAICSWLRDNGVDPEQVPTNPCASIADGKLTIRMFVMGEDGRRQWEPGTSESAKRAVTVPLLVPPTPEVELWLTPACPTCGR